MNSKPLLSGTQSLEISIYHIPSTPLTEEPKDPLLLAISKNDLKLFQNTIIDYQNKDLRELKDNNRRSVLHLSAFINNGYMFYSLMHTQTKYMEQQNYKQSEIDSELTKWILEQDSENNNALHLSIYQGNIEIFQFAKKFDINFIKMKPTLIHLAVKSNQVRALVYLKIRENIPPFIINSDGTTALHQACFFGAEECVNFLLAWGLNPNAQDNFGYTPLHLCAINGHAKIVKKLLYRGAKKTLKDFYGDTPAIAAQKNNQESVFKILTSNSAKCAQTFIRMSIKPRRRVKTYFFAFIALYLTSFFITLLFPIPYVETDWPIYLFISQAVLTTMFFLMASFCNPGYLEKGNNDFYDLIQQFDMDDICPDCSLARPFRSKHCEFCERCVMVYDHHCPWIDNCIGAKNLIYFLLFIASLNFYMVTGISINIACIESDTVHHENLQVMQILFYLRVIFQTVIAFLEIIFLISMMYLLWTQINNLFLDMTTFERFTLGRVQRGNKNTRRISLVQRMVRLMHQYNCQSLKDSHEQYSCYNIALMCCLNKKNNNYLVNDGLQ